MFLWMLLVWWLPLLVPRDDLDHVDLTDIQYDKSVLGNRDFIWQELQRFEDLGCIEDGGEATVYCDAFVGCLLE